MSPAPADIIGSSTHRWLPSVRALVLLPRNSLLAFGRLRRGLLVFLLGSGGLGRSAGSEGQLVTLAAHLQDGVVRDLAAQDFLRQRILDELLDGPAQRTRAQLRVEALFHDEVADGIRDLDLDVAGAEAALQ